jgi:integrase
MGRWAEASRKLPANPFCNLRIQTKKVVAEIPEPWTREERDQIIEGFRRSAKFHHYGNFVEFLFLCGCRPSEALALNWADVASDCRKLTFRSALTSNQSGKKAIKAGLKRQKARQVPLNRRLAELFLEMKGSAKSDRIVFTTPRGGLINWSSWSAKVWAPQLKALGLPHKKPYSTRHTMITLALQCGVSVADVATLVGNSPEIIHRHYAGVSRDLRLPE